MARGVLARKGRRRVRGGGEAERLPLHLVHLLLVLLAAPRLLAKPRLGPSSLDNRGKVAVWRVAGLGGAVAVLHTVRGLAVGDAHVGARPHHAVACDQVDGQE